ncbi:hypothetical protein PGT21_012868 [Puccinia graminis f. sp. tritici]|uniref:Uncharacterized protein n=1 Tax=Puccinia graminis f. sp. tritici TaxID=56615 RepID=A0A5B0QAI3_PUCGR|nr:hypothetical protein PGT21_012868 [Puccinia graminis f. sp. tritici]
MLMYDLLREYVLNPESTRIDEVGFTLGQMGYLFSNALGAIFRPSANDEMVDELVERNELIDQLQSSLLPSIKDCIASLLLSIGLQDSGSQPKPNLDLVSEATAKIDETLWRTTAAVESVSAPFEGRFTHERNLGRCKDFRSLRLHRKVRMIIIHNLCRLFESGAESMRFWELSRKHPENLEYPKEMSEWVEQTHMFANRSCRLIDQTIESLQQTDLAILQEEWLEAQDSIDGTLEDLTKLAMRPRIEGMAINGPERRINRTPREHIAQVARLTIPILKLTRIFLNKISNTTPRKAMFRLDPEIDSESLKQLSEGPSRIAQLLETLVICLVELEKQNRRIDMSGNRLSTPLIKIPKLLESNLLLVSFYLIPLPVPVDEHIPPIRNHFKPWFLDLQSQYRKAVDRMLDALCDPLNERPGFDSDPE